MEKRKIVVVSSTTQSQIAFESDAVTLGDLKRELDARNVDYNGMTFLEGHSKVELKVDDAVLPTNIPYKGTVTNDLVFLMTSPQNKIKSGMDRVSIYAFIKDHNLQKEIEEKFHRNYTNVSTDDLNSFIFEFTGDYNGENRGKCYPSERTSCTADSYESEEEFDPAEAFTKAIGLLVDVGVDMGWLKPTETNVITIPDEHNIISDEKLDELFGDLV